MPPFLLTLSQRTNGQIELLQCTSSSQSDTRFQTGCHFIQKLRGNSSKVTATFCSLGVSGRTVVYRHRNCSGGINSVPASAWGIRNMSELWATVSLANI